VTGAIVVDHGKIDRIDTIEIRLVHDMLATRPPCRRLAEQIGQRPDCRIERRHCRQAKAGTALFEPVAHRAIDQRVDDQPRPAHDFFYNAIKMSLGAYHRPEMLDRLDAFEPRQPRLGDRFERFSGRIADQMQMQAAGFERHWSGSQR
jgi:hypothetical protein